MSATPEVRVYVGTRARRDDHVHCLALDLSSGELRELVRPHPAESPSFIVLHPDGSTLYAVNEIGASANDRGGAVTSYRIAADGALSLLNTAPSGGAAPCFLSVDDEGAHLFVANYWGGSAAIFRLGPDGSIGDRTALLQHVGGPVGGDRDLGPHPHWIARAADGPFCIVTDLGLDQVLAYRFDERTGSIAPESPAIARLASGAGPRHCAGGARGRYFVLSELQSAVLPVIFDAASGTFAVGDPVSTLPPGYVSENAAAEIALGRGGHALYVSNRGHDSIAWFSVDEQSGALSVPRFAASGGRKPRHFEIDPTGRFLVVVNQASDSVTVFALDPTTGEPRPVGRPYPVRAPTCVRMRRFEVPTT